MQQTSEKYRALLSGDHRVETRLSIGDIGCLIDQRGDRITFGGVSILVGASGADAGYDESVLVNLKTKSQMFSGNTPEVGSCISGEIDVEMLKPAGTIPRQARLVPYVRLTDGVTTSEWIQKGVYFVDTRETDVSEHGVEWLHLHGYDAMLRSEQSYPPSRLSWPARDIDVVREIAAAMEVSVDRRTAELMTFGYQIQYPADYSCREVLGYIAAMYAGSFVMSDLGEMRLVTLYGIPPETNYLIDHAGDAITFGGMRIRV